MTLAMARELRYSLDVVAIEIERMPRERLSRRGREALHLARLQVDGLVTDAKAARQTPGDSSTASRECPSIPASKTQPPA